MTRTYCIPSATLDNDQEKLAAYCRALAHTVRVEIIKLLLDKGECISGDIAHHFDRSHSTISEHLRILKEADLVLGTIDGPKRCYCANAKALKHMKQLLNLLSDHPGCCLPTPITKEGSERGTV